ncbi:MAG: asparagine synthase C-terminal domain-containing protein, partial [Saprospiraceae bacterium]
FDESGYARIIAEKYQTNHTVFELGASDMLSMIPEILLAQDSPSGDGPNTYIVSQLTKEAGIKVVLSGLGGDELFVGYENFHRWKKLNDNPLLHAWAKIPQGLRKWGISGLQNLTTNAKFWRILELLKVESYRIDEVYPLLRQVFTQPEYSKLLQKSNFPNRAKKMLGSQLPSLLDIPVYSQYSRAEILGYTGNVLLKDTDQMSMAHGLEVREPFFDLDLASWVLRQPDTAKEGFGPKPMLTRALGDRLPSEIVHRPKMGFSFPWRQWLFGPLKPMAMEFLQALQRRPEWNAKGLQTIMDRLHSNDPKLPWTRVWYLVALSAWMENNLD